MMLFFAGIFLFAGCGVMANGRGWGQDATMSPGWERIGRAARNAVVAPETWAPAAGALAFQIGHADRKVAEWASSKTPLYGSRYRAEQMSDDLQRSAGALWIVSAVITPGGDEISDWAVNKAWGIGIQTGTGVLLKRTVGFLKDSTNRTQPNGLDKDSFPSAHASNTALYTSLASKNIETLGWSDTPVTMTRIGLGALTAATAWARLEADFHYPSDVLAGIALGHFFGSFFTDAFIGVENPRNIRVLFEPSNEGIITMLRFGF
jgi:membrane-associated phospholipid phosphatase